MNNLNILYPITGDQKFGKRLIFLLSLFILAFVGFIFLFQNFPSKYQDLKNEYYTANQKNQFIHRNDNNDEFYVWNGYYNDLRKLDYFIMGSGFNLNRTVQYRDWEIRFNSIIRIFEKKNKIEDKDIKFTNIDHYNITSNNLENSVSYDNFEREQFIFRCRRNRCRTRPLFDIKVSNFKNVLVQIFFFKAENKNNFGFINSIEINSIKLNNKYQLYLTILRGIITLLAILYYIYYMFNIRKIPKKFYTFEHKFLIYLGLLYIFYNDPFYYFRIFLGSYVYSVIYSLELGVFFTSFLYFNYNISIKMNHYEKNLTFKTDLKITILFILFFIAFTCLFVYVEWSLLFDPIILFERPTSLFYIIIIIIGILLYSVIIISTFYNFIKILFNWKQKTNRTKGLVLFSIFFNLLFFGNIITELIFVFDPYNTEFVFYVMINYYVMYLFLFYTFNKTKTLNFNENTEESLRIITMTDVNEKDKLDKIQEENLFNNLKKENDDFAKEGEKNFYKSETVGFIVDSENKKEEVKDEEKKNNITENENENDITDNNLNVNKENEENISEDENYKENINVIPNYFQENDVKIEDDNTKNDIKNDNENNKEKENEKNTKYFEDKKDDMYFEEEEFEVKEQN